MGGGQSNTKQSYKVNDGAAGAITDVNTTSQETLIKAQLKARKNRMKEKKVRKKGIKGTTGLDISSTGSMHHMVHTDKSEESVKVIKEALHRHFLFHALPQAVIGNAIACLYEVVVKKGSNIISQGDDGNEFFILEKGAANVFINDKDIKKTLRPGASFGELALLYSEPRSATIKATEECHLWALDSANFRTSLAQHYTDEHRGFNAVLQQVPLLQKLNPMELQALAECAVEVFFNAGAIICKEGEPGEVFYFIIEGSCEVFVKDEKNPSQEIHIRNMGKTDFFGERALLHNEVRSATVKAVEDVRCGAIDRVSFHNILGPLTDDLETMKKEQDKDERDRRQSFVAKFKNDCSLDDLEIKGILGRGGFGFVFLVRNKVNDDRYAMKKISKLTVIEKKQHINILNEKRVLQSMKHPFIPKLYLSTQDKDCLYLVIELLQGGDLFSALVDRPDQVFDEVHCIYYTAIIVETLRALHYYDILYRDLKPENMVLHKTGVLKLVDFGFAKQCRRTFTMCGTQDYISPEMILGKGHGKGVDYWALGCVLFEFCYGYLPFQRDTATESFSAIMKASFEIEEYDDEPWLKGANELIKNLLQPEISRRYGCGHEGVEVIKKSPFFATIDWKKLVALEIAPPSIPVCNDDDDVSNFKDVDTEGIKRGVRPYAEKPEHKGVFDNF